MGSKVTAQKCGPAKSRTTGKRKAAKQAIVATSTPKTRPRATPVTHRSVVAVVDDTEEELDRENFSLNFEEGTSIFEVADQVDLTADDGGILDELLDSQQPVESDDESDGCMFYF
jgi:hypothetical protein